MDTVDTVDTVDTGGEADMDAEAGMEGTVGSAGAGATKSVGILAWKIISSLPRYAPLQSFVQNNIPANLENRQMDGLLRSLNR